MKKNEVILDNIEYMLKDVKGYEKEYNKIANWLWKQFHISSAELSLYLTTYEKHREEIFQ